MERSVISLSPSYPSFSDITTRKQKNNIIDNGKVQNKTGHENYNLHASKTRSRLVLAYFLYYFSLPQRFPISIKFGI